MPEKGDTNSEDNLFIFLNTPDSISVMGLLFMFIKTKVMNKGQRAETEQ